MRDSAARSSQSQYLHMALHGYHAGLHWLDVLKQAVEVAEDECGSADLRELLAELKSRLEREPDVQNTAQAVSKKLPETVDIPFALAAAERMYPNHAKLPWRMTSRPQVAYLPDEGKVAVTVTMQHNKSVAHALADSILRYAVDSASQRAV